MTERLVQIKQGLLQPRAVAILVAQACRCEDQVLICMENVTVNAKSMMGVLSLGNIGAKTLTLRVTGPNEQAEAERLAPYLEAAFE